uniref:Apt1 n=1 Tax=Arundo donax TaxID=35708 RepID=A0A0A9CAK4_ARUDO
MQIELRLDNINHEMSCTFLFRITIIRRLHCSFTTCCQIWLAGYIGRWWLWTLDLLRLCRL